MENTSTVTVLRGAKVSSGPPFPFNKQLAVHREIPEDIKAISGIVWAFLTIHGDTDDKVHQGVRLLLEMDSLEVIDIIVPDVLCLQDLEHQLGELGPGGLLFIERTLCLSEPVTQTESHQGLLKRFFKRAKA